MTDFAIGDVIRIDGSSLHPDWNGSLAIVIEVNRDILRYKMCVGLNGGTINKDKVTHMLRPIDPPIMEDTREYLRAVAE